MKEVIKYHPNGNILSKSHYIDNKLEGIYEEYYYSNGAKRIEINYKNGLKHGISQYWHLNGDKNEISYYNEGKQKISKLYINGNKLALIIYRIDNTSMYISYPQIKIDVYPYLGNELKALANKQCKVIKEELIANVYHPDRLERFAKAYNMDAMDYMDVIE